MLAAAALIYLLTPELMRDQAGHGPGEADWTGEGGNREGSKAEKCSHSSERESRWVGSKAGQDWASPWSSTPSIMREREGGRERGSLGEWCILVKPLTFNSHLSSNIFHLCVPVALQGPGMIRSGLC